MSTKHTQKVRLIRQLKVSFTIGIPLKQTDIHSLKKELLKKREEVSLEIFLEILKKLMDAVEEEAIKSKGLFKEYG